MRQVASSSGDGSSFTCRDHPDAFVGFGSTDPLKGARAVEEIDRIAELGLKGVKLHPSLQAFAPDDERYWPLYERCEERGLATDIEDATRQAVTGLRGFGYSWAEIGHRFGVTR